MKPPQRARRTGALIESHLISRKTFHLFALSFNFYDYVHFRSDCYCEDGTQTANIRFEAIRPARSSIIFFFFSFFPPAWRRKSSLTIKLQKGRAKLRGRAKRH